MSGDRDLEKLIHTKPQSPNKLWRIAILWTVVLIGGLALLNAYVL